MDDLQVYQNGHFDTSRCEASGSEKLSEASKKYPFHTQSGLDHECNETEWELNTPGSEILALTIKWAQSLVAEKNRPTRRPITVFLLDQFSHVAKS